MVSYFYHSYDGVMVNFKKPEPGSLFDNTDASYDVDFSVGHQIKLVVPAISADTGEIQSVLNFLGDR